MKKKVFIAIILTILSVSLSFVLYDDLINAMYESQNNAGLAGEYNVKKEVYDEHDTTHEKSNK